jgi:hypothetical protein
MHRLGWTLFAHLLLLVAGAGTVTALQSTPPTQPTGFGGAATSTTSIQWSWGASTGSTTITYEIHAVPETSPATIIASGLPSTSYLETGLSENTQYSRDVYAVASDGTKSLASNIGKRYTLIHTAETADFSPAATSTSAIQITVVPPPNAFSDQTGVQVFRNVPTAKQITPFSQVYAPSDTGLQPDTSYCYNIEFRNGDGIPSGPGPSSLCATTNKESKNCVWKISIESNYTYPDKEENQERLVQYFEDDGSTTTLTEGTYHTKVVSKGTNIHHLARLRVRPLTNSDHVGVIVQEIPHEYTGKPFSLTTLTIELDSDDCTPKLTWTGKADGVLESDGKDAFLGTGSWAMASASHLEGSVDTSYKAPLVGLASVAETTDKDAEMIAFVGGDIGPIFGGVDINWTSHKHDNVPIVGKVDKGTKTKKQFEFKFDDHSAISGAIKDPWLPGSVLARGEGKMNHEFHIKGGGANGDEVCIMSLRFINDGKEAVVSTLDSTGTHTYILVAPDAAKAPTGDAFFPGGGGIWSVKE